MGVSRRAIRFNLAEACSVLNGDLTLTLAQLAQARVLLLGKAMHEGLLAVEELRKLREVDGERVLRHGLQLDHLPHRGGVFHGNPSLRRCRGICKGAQGRKLCT
jgi:hypothetical protein